MSARVQFVKLLLVPETLAAITGLITWKKWEKSYLKWFVIYLCIIVVNETCNRFINIKTSEGVNIFREIVVPIEMMFLNWFFYKTLTPNNRMLVLAGIGLYVISWICENTFFAGEGYYFRSLSYTVGNLFVAVYTILFFINFVKTEAFLQFNKLAVFWIVLGMLVFYLGTFPFFGLYNELAKSKTVWAPAAWTAISLDYCMYILFTIGFLWGKPH